MAISWKAGLPTTYLQDGYDEGFPDIILRSAMDSGGVFKTRLKSTAGYFPLKVSMRYDSTQKASFDLFLKDDLKFGTLPVEFPSVTYNTTGNTVEAFIVGRKWQVVSGNIWILQLDLLALLE